MSKNVGEDSWCVDPTSHRFQQRFDLESGVDGSGCKLLGVGSRRQPAQCLLGSFFVVFPAPGFDRCPGMQQVGEQVLVEELVTESPVERFDVGILVRLVRLDQPKLHATLVRQRHHGLAAELLAIVGADDLR